MFHWIAHDILLPAISLPILSEFFLSCYKTGRPTFLQYYSSSVPVIKFNVLYVGNLVTAAYKMIPRSGKTEIPIGWGPSKVLEGVVNDG